MVSSPSAAVITIWPFPLCPAAGLAIVQLSKGLVKLGVIVVDNLYSLPVVSKNTAVAFKNDGSYDELPTNLLETFPLAATNEPPPTPSVTSTNAIVSSSVPSSFRKWYVACPFIALLSRIGL